MSARRPNDIPPATDELLAAGQRKVGEGRLDLRRLKPAGIDDDETERHVETITQSYGAHAQIAPAHRKASALRAMPEPSVVAPPVAQRTHYASFRIDLPDYLDEELRLRSARDRATKTFLIMDALHRAGYTVKPEDLVADRRKTRFQRD